MIIDNKDWLIIDGVVIRYKGSATEVIVPDGVKEIGESAFEFKKIDKVHLPEGLIKIGDSAFSYCKLSEIKFPTTLIRIGKYAFYNNLLEKVVIPNNVTHIGIRAFKKNKLKNVILSNSLTEIETGVFRDNNLEEITIPNSVTSIGEEAFTNNKLIKVILSKNLVEINEWAFSENQLKHIEFPDTLTWIGSLAFMQNKIMEITIPNNIKIFQLSFFELNPMKKITILNPLIFKPENKYSNFGELPIETIIVPTFDNNTLTKIVELSFADTLKEILVKDTSISSDLQAKLRDSISTDIIISYGEPSVKIETSVFNKEIADLIEVINRTVADLEKKYQKLIKNRAEDLINNYNNQYKKIKPQLNLDDEVNILSLDDNTCKFEISELVLELKKILIFAKKVNKYIHLSKQIEKYKLIIDSNIEYFPTNTNDLSDKIKYIIYISQHFNDIEIKEKLSTIINNISDEISNYLNNIIVLKNAKNFGLQLNLQITLFYEDVCNKYGKNISILKQLNNSITILQNNNITPIGSIDSTILDIVTSIDNLDNSDKLNIYNKLEQIINNWIIRLQNEKMLVVNEWNNDINIQDDSLKIQIMILKDIYSIDYKVKKYIKQKQLYSSHKL